MARDFTPLAEISRLLQVPLTAVKVAPQLSEKGTSLPRGFVAFHSGQISQRLIFFALAEGAYPAGPRPRLHSKEEFPLIVRSPQEWRNISDRAPDAKLSQSAAFPQLEVSVFSSAARTTTPVRVSRSLSTPSSVCTLSFASTGLDGARRRGVPLSPHPYFSQE